MRDAELLKPITEFLIKKRKQGEGRPNNFSGKITFLFSEIRKEVPRLNKLIQIEELFKVLKQKDCWFNGCKEGAIHGYTIVHKTTEADAQITVDCTTSFLSVKLKDLGGQIEEEAETNKKVIIISKDDIKIKKDKKATYPISGRRKDIIIFLLQNKKNPIPGKEMTKEFKCKLSKISDEIGEINKMFIKNTKLKLKLIINKPQGSGYRLNSENFIFEQE